MPKTRMAARTLVDPRGFDFLGFAPLQSAVAAHLRDYEQHGLDPAEADITITIRVGADPSGPEVVVVDSIAWTERRHLAPSDERENPA